MTEVTNVSGTGYKTCKCASWLDHWTRRAGCAPSLCSVVGCSEREPIGAVVVKTRSYDLQLYVVPLCPAHSTTRGTLAINDEYPLVPAAVDANCG